MPGTLVLATLLMTSAGGCLLAQQPDPLADPLATASDYTALTGNQRWQRYAENSVLNPGLYFAVLGSAIGQQIGNTPPEWRQGLKGYGRRSVSQFGVFSLEIGIREATAAMLHYEPRFVRSGRTGFLPRVGHAIAWSFITYDADRHQRLNIPAIASAYGSGIISTAWYPARYSALHDGVRTGNQQMGLAVGVNIFREFAPELKRLLHLKQ